jgi:hypothetical protein
VAIATSTRRRLVADVALLDPDRFAEAPGEFSCCVLPALLACGDDEQRSRARASKDGFQNWQRTGIAGRLQTEEGLYECRVQM